MAFYHYWFNGKMLLQKPAEHLLAWKDVDMNFMFFWANHDWVRSWNGSRTMLMEQTYGGIEDWEAHFDYMLPFFTDPRYIRIEGKPAFGIYMADAIPDLDNMISYWNERAIKEGLNGIYIIETALTPKYESKYNNVNALVLRQPNIANRELTRLFQISKKKPEWQKFFPFCYPGIVSYSMAMSETLRHTKHFTSNKTIMYGAFVGWDNTCRHGRRGFIVKGQTPEKFKKCLIGLKKLADKNGVEYLFVNAWNEWAEGMYLEPDTKDGFGYLEAIRDVIKD